MRRLDARALRVGISAPEFLRRKTTWESAMKIAHGEDIPEVVRRFEHREGAFHHRKLMTGERGTPGNFSLELVSTTTDFFSPRHRHNFDQFRYQLEGEFDFDRNGKMKPGILGYFPEGTPYGPQSSSVKSLTLTLQFGGASRSGYMSQEEMEAGMTELKQRGRFEKGVYRRNEGEEGKRNVDGYQAIWEHVNKRPMKYPDPRYHDPIMIDPSHFAWVQRNGDVGVYEKLLGVFTEYATQSRLLRLEPSATFVAEGRRLYFVLTGEGRLGADRFRRHTTVLCERGEEIGFIAGSATEILEIGLPRLETIEAHAVAAE
jgi:hypothetical protein